MFAIFSDAELVYHLSFTTHCHIKCGGGGGGSIHNLFSREIVIGHIDEAVAKQTTS